MVQHKVNVSIPTGHKGHIGRLGLQGRGRAIPMQPTKATLHVRFCGLRFMDLEIVRANAPLNAKQNTNASQHSLTQQKP